MDLFFELNTALKKDWLVIYLASLLECMPVISRDQIKEGYVHTFGKRHSELPEDTNLRVTEIFFASIKNLLRNRISLIAEAAFQHKIWNAMLKDYYSIARVHLLICKVDEKVALERYIRRGLDNPLREYFHGDKGVDLARQGIEVMAGPYKEPRIDAATFHIDTTGSYVPAIKELEIEIFGGSRN